MPNNYKDRVPRRWKNHLIEVKDHYRITLDWDKLRDRMAEAVDSARARKPYPLRIWEKDWSKYNGNKT